jgi:hypothetical protein
MFPKEMQLTVTPDGPSSLARQRLNAAAPDFAAAYTD